MQISKQKFLSRNKEKAEFNQYWYSEKTIEFMVKQCNLVEGNKVAFLSTPSVYFSLPEDCETRKNSFIFDLDIGFEKKAKDNYYCFDFYKNHEIPEKFFKFFDYVLIDPPFITHEVWEKYAETSKIILKDNGRVLCSTIDENETLLRQLFNTERKTFRPLIPNLVYQYSLYANYDHEEFNQINPEIGF